MSVRGPQTAFVGPNVPSRYTTSTTQGMLNPGASAYLSPWACEKPFRFCASCIDEGFVPSIDECVPAFEEFHHLAGEDGG